MAAEIPIEAVTLSRYAVATRYPGEMDELDRDEAASAADLASQVAAWVNRQVFPKEE